MMYLILWEFHAKPGYKEELIRLNMPSGKWGQLFSKGYGYLGTEVLSDLGNNLHIITIDRWISQKAYEEFCHQYQSEYQTMDNQLEKFTDKERHLGSFAVNTQ